MTQATHDPSSFQFFQVGLNSCDLAGTVRLYADIFGFANGGAQVGWGDTRRIQELDTDGQNIAWWLVAAQRQMQLEIFSFSGPPSRPQPADWSPADLGWVRMGIAVTDFDRVLDGLARVKISPFTPVSGEKGGRRVAMRDPHVGVIVEIIEDGSTVIGYPRERRHGLDPVVLYATHSVADLTDARRFYGDILGLPILPLETLHRPEHEALWGLSGAQRDGFVVQAGDGYLEVVSYAEPRGRRKRPDYLLSDQGIMNVGLLTRDTAVVRKVIDKQDADGKPPKNLVVGGEQFLGTYINYHGREVEIVAAPEEADVAIGLIPVAPFIGGGDPNGLFRIVPRS